MIVYTDSLSFAGTILPGELSWSASPREYSDPGIQMLASRLFSADDTPRITGIPHEFWRHLFLIERVSDSQFDAVVELCRENVELPDGLLCLAGSGDRLHGRHNRPWIALPGNIHLTAHLTPKKKTGQIGVGFSVLSAISVIETIDRIPDLKGLAGIKWVNDIVIDDAKVAGFITHTANFEDIVTSAVIGIGLNVEAAPPITPDRFFYRGACLRDFVSGCAQGPVFVSLIEALSRNYRRLLAGELPRLVDEYRRRSIIIGREVEILPDSPHRPDDPPIRGIVQGIGDNLELILKGRKEPITRGRSVLYR